MIIIKTAVVMPAMDSIPTRTVKCLEYMRRLPETYTAISECTLVHDARNEFASRAITQGFDRVLWIDSDMVFDQDMLVRMSADMDEGHDLVCGIFFKREIPTTPVIYSAFRDVTVNGQHGIEPSIYFDYPHDALFPIAGCGFGAVMTTVDLLRRVWDKYGPPFSLHSTLGEDLSFCFRAGQLGADMVCDSRIKVGHLGRIVYDESMYVMNRNGLSGKDGIGTVSNPDSTTPGQQRPGSEDSGVIRDPDRSASKNNGKTVSTPYYVPIVNSMWRYYFRYRTESPASMHPVDCAAWTACDTVMHQLKPYQQLIAEQFYADRNLAAAHRTSKNNGVDLWPIISAITRRTAEVRGILKPKTAGRIHQNIEVKPDDKQS